MKTLTAQEARKWMIENPGEKLLLSDGKLIRLNASEYFFEYREENTDWMAGMPVDGEFTLPQPEPRYLKDIRELEGVEAVRYTRPAWFYRGGELEGFTAGWTVNVVSKIHALLSLGVQIEVVK